MDDGLNPQVHPHAPSNYINVGGNFDNIDPINNETKNEEGKLDQDFTRNHLNIEINFNHIDHSNNVTEDGRANDNFQV